ncbi:hypothetical protein SERLA73DRAFT_191921 [Serpula lacrymans var. lacrymans S7.3]|uniref:Uncharacterized protein n=2 Tax=Serpula lacrymans var. lacrymans TaxID=341189 RepID=F8QIL9_SERL3|nr:uncharacterized protein SERLADRAFT_465890 [Serpula lacrymans var. lacrymans S7.9]EGN91858.1 hypothetical protein SERLA73DRAFT_191921 [Serpula lacrymans var. lacrymans S7.3]EGO25559.1 hypothetical protein SERLADRAFT_465890 [Serpula lacrymans var. lacrymans S7.9]
MCHHQHLQKVSEIFTVIFSTDPVVPTTDIFGELCCLSAYLEDIQRMESTSSYLHWSVPSAPGHGYLHADSRHCE